MGNIYVDMSIGFGFILFCMLMTIVWILFRNLKKRLLPGMAKQEDTIPPDILEEALEGRYNLACKPGDRGKDHEGTNKGPWGRRGLYCLL